MAVTGFDLRSSVILLELKFWFQFVCFLEVDTVWLCEQKKHCRTTQQINSDSRFITIQFEKNLFRDYYINYMLVTEIRTRPWSKLFWFIFPLLQVFCRYDTHHGLFNRSLYNSKKYFSSWIYLYILIFPFVIYLFSNLLMIYGISLYLLFLNIHIFLLFFFLFWHHIKPH